MKHLPEFQEALDLIEENEHRLVAVKRFNKHGTDIANNVMQGLMFTKTVLKKTTDPDDIKAIARDLGTVRNKLRLAVYASDMTNVELNKLINGNFLT
jgi:hypothetical protein